MNRKGKEIFIKISLVFLGMAITLILVEGLARLLAPAPGNVQFMPDPELGYRHVPNQNTWVRDENGEFAAWFKTNPSGDPDLVRSVEKPDGVYRIAVIGDSMVEAAQVPLEQRFTYLLEKELTAAVQKRAGKIQKVEVLNFGTAGYGTAQEFLYYRSHVRKFSPDLVLLLFLPGNDIKNNSYELEVVQSCRPELAPFLTLTADQELVVMNEQFYDKALARYQKADLTLIQQMKRWMQAEIRLIDLASQAYTALRSRAAGSTASQNNASIALTGSPNEKAPRLDQDACQTETTLQLYDPEFQRASLDWTAAWQLTEAILQRFAQDAAADGAAFQMVTVTGPWEVQAETRDLVLTEEEQQRYDWELPLRMTAKMAARLGISNLQLLPAMQRAVQEDGTDVHYIYNGHYTPAGHQIVAQVLFTVLQDDLLK